MSKEVSHDAHRHNLQRFVAGVGNRDKKFNRKEEKQMRIKILAEIEVPEGEYCVRINNVSCVHLLKNAEGGEYCGVFQRDLKSEYGGRVPIKCATCRDAGQVRGMVCSIDGDCNG